MQTIGRLAATRLQSRRRDQLQHLQIAFVGLGASDAPRIYLDAADVQVSYADAPENATDTSPLPPPPPVPTETAPQNFPTPAQALQEAFSPWAAQVCAVTPFSATIEPGASAAFLLKLIPSAASSTASSTPGGVASSSFLYEASIGSLPDGATSYLTKTGSGNDTIVVQTTPAIARGSYSIVVVYRERQHDGSILPNYCQFSLDVQ